ncbi:MAG: hypothetical protein R3C68_02260 [Myxococcota bacterium]
MPGSKYIAECVAGDTVGVTQNMWRAYDCDDICREAGYGRATMCNIDFSNFSDSVCYCEDLCEPACAFGYHCVAGRCQLTYPPLPPPGRDECYSDADCGIQRRCNFSLGRCEYVECTSDSHCGFCKQCNGNVCDSCGFDADGECNCL